VKVGVVGGTFDPVHLGHIAMAEAAAACAGLDRVLLIPSNVPPHRSAAMASAADRLEMARLAAVGHPRLEISDIELRRPGPSYTVDTLRQLKTERPDDELCLVLGWDAARDIRAWRSPDELMHLAGLVIVTRPGYSHPSPAELAAAGIDAARVEICDAPTPDVESTDVRRLIEEGGSLQGVVDPAVELYIRGRGLYLAP